MKNQPQEAKTPTNTLYFFEELARGVIDSLKIVYPVHIIVMWFCLVFKEG